MTAEEKLKEIADILDNTYEDDDGKTISTDAYYNLEGAIQDIERTGQCDEVSLGTLKNVQEQLGRVFRVLASNA